MSMQKVISLKVETRKVRKVRMVRRVKMVKTRNVASSQPEAQTAVEAPSLPASSFALHHVGSPTHAGEPEMTGATFGGPAHAGEPDDGPDAGADHPEIPF